MKPYQTYTSKQEANKPFFQLFSALIFISIFGCKPIPKYDPLQASLQCMSRYPGLYERSDSATLIKAVRDLETLSSNEWTKNAFKQNGIELELRRLKEYLQSSTVIDTTGARCFIPIFDLQKETWNVEVSNALSALRYRWVQSIGEPRSLLEKRGSVSVVNYMYGDKTLTIKDPELIEKVDEIPLIFEASKYSLMMLGFEKFIFQVDENLPSEIFTVPPDSIKYIIDMGIKL